MGRRGRGFHSRGKDMREPVEEVCGPGLCATGGRDLWLMCLHKGVVRRTDGDESEDWVTRK